jgi:hypothetical protein
MTQKKPSLQSNGNAIADRCEWCIITGHKDDLLEIKNLIHWSYQKERYIFYRNHDSQESGKDDIAGDDVKWLKLACLYFDILVFDFYFKDLSRKKRLSDKFKITYDLLWFCKINMKYSVSTVDWNKIFQLSLLYIPLFSRRLNQIIKWIGGLKKVQPHQFVSKPRIYENGIRITTLWQLIRNRKQLKPGGWKFREYLAAEILPMFARYTLLQTAWQLRYLPETKYTKYIQKSLRKMTWNRNPLIWMLTGVCSNYHHCHSPRKDMSNQYCNQSTVCETGDRMLEIIDNDPVINFVEREYLKTKYLCKKVTTII